MYKISAKRRWEYSYFKYVKHIRTSWEYKYSVYAIFVFSLTIVADNLNRISCILIGNSLSKQISPKNRTGFGHLATSGKYSGV